MKKTWRFLRIVLIIVCCLISIEYVLYFSLGNQFKYEFADRHWAKSFTNILVFSTAVSIYLLFILSMSSKSKWWKNLMLFGVGLIFSLIPIISYHGFYQFQCDFWNQKRIKTEVIATNKWSRYKTIEVQIHQCLLNDQITVDTVLVDKRSIPFLYSIKPATYITLKSGSWIPSK